MCITTCELREKAVINVCDGQKLGCASELEIDTECGRVTAIIVYGDGIASLLFARNRIRIPWDNIKCIGQDALLVEYHDEERRCSGNSRGKCKKC